MQMNQGNLRLFKAKLEVELFAEDLVYHVMHMHECFNFTRCKAALYRPFLYPAFTINMFNAISHLTHTLKERVINDFRKLHEDNMITAEAFPRYAMDLAADFLSDGLDPVNFLKFCVILSCVAARFFLHNVKEAPEIAIEEIEKALMYDLCQGGWEVLEMTAQNHAKMFLSLDNCLTPENSSLSSDED